MKHHATKQNNISEKLVDLKISIKSLYSYIITYYARFREKRGEIPASLQCRKNKIVKIFVEGCLFFILLSNI